MEASVKLLNEYINLDDYSAKEVADKLTSIGHEVEGMHPFACGDHLVIGEVLECVPHPDSDHLHVCKVQTSSDDIRQIVCGAPNIAKGQKVIVAMPGCTLTDNFKIKEGVIRGQESNGMICSIAELGIDKRLLREEDTAGIHVLDKDAPVGEDALKYMGYDDTILEIGLTSNRADCMAMISLAYEVGALLNREVKVPEERTLNELPSEIKVDIETDKCAVFGAKLVKGVTTKQSPEWLRTFLMASGIKPINNVVDISNFVMVETGQPIHMYDYDKLKEKKFTIKTGFTSKEVLLDEKEYQLEKDDIIVSTDGGVGCVAGVMGGNDTKIDDTTTNIVIEAATFDGPTLRNTARRLNLLTDASQHYIKGAIDSSNTKHVLNRCASLLLDLADAKEIYETVITDYKVEEKKVKVSTYDVNHLLGTDISTEEIKDIFTRLHFGYELNDETFNVTVPSYRNDITMAADLIEEVARLHGYNSIPSTLPEMEMTRGELTNAQSTQRYIRHLLSDLGLHETITYTLTSPSKVDDFNLFHTTDTVKLLLPLGEERSVTRKSVIPSLLETINYNNAHACKDVNIFEISNTYSKDEEITLLTLACTGLVQNVPWKGIRNVADFYVVKGYVETIFKKLNIDAKRYTIEPVEKDNTAFHPGRSGYIKMGKDIVGVVGCIHPKMAKKYDVKNVYVAELNLSALTQVKTSKLKFTDIPAYPSVSRDIALVMDQSIPTINITKAITKTIGRLITNIEIFDIYEGENIGENKKSVAFSITFQDPSKTLEEGEVSTMMNRILEVVEKDFDAHIRG